MSVKGSGKAAKALTSKQKIAELEARLRASEEWARVLAESTAEWVFFASPESGFVYSSPSCTRVTGYPPDSFSADPRLLEAILHPDDRERVVRALARPDDAAAGPFLDFRIAHRTLGSRWLALSREPMLLPGTERPGVRCSVRDITFRKRLEERLVEARMKAELASRAKSEFLANMSHEIRSPISTILAVAELALDGGSPATPREDMETVRSAAASLLAIINDILDFSKIEAGRLDLRPADFSLRGELATLVRTFGAEAGRRGLELSLYIAPGVPDRFRGDWGRLRQVLQNLIHNGLKFTARGGVGITVEALSGDGSKVLFAVADTGIGIRAEDLGKLFKSFTQLDGTRTKEHAGTGLGLAISRRLVEMMDGEIRAESVLGQGSTFSFSVPLAPAGEQPGASAGVHGTLPEVVAGLACAVPGRHLAEGEAGLPLDILVAEDNTAIQRYLAHVLGRAGHRVRVAGNGAEALALLAERPCGCVLMDVNMPGMDGVEAVRRIRAGACGPEAAGVPVIALTAYATKEDGEQFLAAGMDEFLTKPEIGRAHV